MNKKFAAVKKFVKDNQTPLLVTLGAIGGAAAVYVHYDRKILLELPLSSIEKMKSQGGAVIYDNVQDHGAFMLSYLPSK